MNVNSSLFKEALDSINGKLEAIYKKEDRIEAQQNEKSIVKQNSTNKESWPFSLYRNAFYCNTIAECMKYLIPTLSVKVEINGVLYGPFKAMLDTGAQPTLISARLYNVFKCPTTTTTRRLIGVDATPLMIKKKFNVTLRPWFDSDSSITETVWVLPENNAWNPILPNTELTVAEHSLALDLSQIPTITSRCRSTLFWELDL